MEAMLKTAIVNLGTIVNGEWRNPISKGDSILMDQGKIIEVGSVSSEALKSCDVVIDADGAVAIPGLIDSQVHNTFGDYTRARRRLGFLRATRTAALLPPSRRRKFMCRADPQIRRV